MGKREPVKTSWKKGTSGNPNGAPKKENSITHMMKNTSDKDKAEIYAKIIEMCKKGDQRFIDMFLNRSDGKPKESIELDTGENLNSFAEWVKTVAESQKA